MPKKVSVTAQFPRTVDLSIRGASTALNIEVKIDGETKGSLNIGSGSVAWWPSKNSVNGHRISWPKLIEIFEGHKPHRISKKLGK